MSVTVRCSAGIRKSSRKVPRPACRRRCARSERGGGRAGKAIGYVGAGTVEFIADSSRGLRPDGFFFMEMNTRLQVEHPVTEAITGLDLVEWQFRVAAGEPLPLAQSEIASAGAAVEARLYAEDPEHGFLPSAGPHPCDEPQGRGGMKGVRVDTGVAAGDSVTPFYDPMIAKVIVHGPTRAEALAALLKELDDAVVIGPKTNLALLRALLRAPRVRGGTIDTGFIDANLTRLGASRIRPTRGPSTPRRGFFSASATRAGPRRSLRTILGAWRIRSSSLASAE